MKKGFRPRHKGFHPQPSVPPTYLSLVKMIEKSGITLTEPQFKRLWDYHNWLRNRNEDRELTRIINFEAVVVKHYIDCLIVGDLYPLPSPLMDLGSGAGFPGIPLKIRYPEIEMVLAEPRPKKVAFLNEVIERLHLKGIKVFDHKVVSQSFTEPMAGVISRAVEEIPKTLLRCQGCSDKGTKIIFMKGPNADEEIKEAQARVGNIYSLVLDKAYSLPGTSHDRRLIVYERITPREEVSLG